MQPSFSVDEYLRNRQQSTAGNKLDAIIAARDAKLGAIETSTAAKQAALAGQPAPWTERLGLEDSGLGKVVNLGASLFSGASRVAGDVLSLAPDALAAMEESQVSPEQFDAYSRTANGKALPGDAAILNSPIKTGGRTALEQIQEINKVRGVAGKIDQAFDVSSVIDKRNRAELSQQLGDGFGAPWEQVKQGWAAAKGNEKLAGSADIVAGLAKLVYNGASAAVDNPQAAAEYITENVPQLALGVLGKGRALLTASNVGYGIENYRKGIEEYQAQNNGAFPPAEQRQYMAMMAASTALAEVVGDKISLDLLTKPASKTASEVVDQLSRSSIKELIFGTAKAAGKGTLSEAVTEGYQTFAEGEAGNKPATAKEIYEGAVIGGIAGGGLTGGGHALGESAKNAVASAVARAEKEAATTTAATTGDVTALVTPGSSTFDPEAAITSLQAFATREGATPEEHRQAVKQAMSALQQMSDQSEELYAQTPAGKRELAAELKSIDPADTEELAAVQRLLDLPLLQGQELAASEATRKELDGRISALSDTIGSVIKQGAASATAAAPQADDFAGHLATASAKVDAADTVAVEKAQASAQKLINLSMEAPDSLSPEVANKLANDTSNGLSLAQRQHLRVFSAAQVAANKLKTGKKVSQEIYFGDAETKQVGIAQYQRWLADAVAAGHQAGAQRQIKGITKFMASHIGKAKAVREAYARVSENQGSSYQVLRTTDGQWVVKEVPEGVGIADAREATRTNGGVLVHKGSAGLVDQVVQEAAAIKLARASMRSAYSLAFPSGSAAPEVFTAASGAVASGSAAPAPVSAPAPSVKPSVAAAPAVKPAPSPAPTPKAAEKKAATPALVPKVEEKPAATPAPVEAPKQVEVKSEEAKPDPTPTADAAPATTPEAKTEEPKVEAPAKRGPWLKLATVKQSAGNEQTGAIKPLASMQDFLTQWTGKGNQVLAGLLPKKLAKWDKDRREAAARALGNARETLAAWVPLLDASMPLAKTWEAVNEDFRDEDMLHTLAEGVGEDGRALLPESVLTAMAYGAYSWLLDKANAPALMSEEQLAEMHGRPEGADIYGDALGLRGAIAFQDTVIGDLGALALQALGIKADKKTPKNMLPRLQNALGTHALLLLEQQGLVKREFHQTKRVAIEVFGETGAGIGAAAVNTYIALVRDGYKPAGLAKDIVEANRGAGGVVDLLFGSERAPRIASNERADFKQQFAKNSSQRITRRMAKALQATMDTPHTVIPEMLDLFLNLGRENVLKAAGWVDPDTVHGANVAATQAKNLGLENQYDQAFEMMGLTEDQSAADYAAQLARAKSSEWFVTPEVWKVFRVGIATQSLNQQTSKIHRYLFQRPAWKSTIDLANQEQVDRFLISLGQNLGMKTDAQVNERTLQLVQDKYLADGAAASKAADAINRGEWSDQDKALITDFAAAEGVVALQALQALAKYRAAKASGAKSFDVTLLVGADGKTNGPILTMLAMGAAGSLEKLKRLLNRGGMYFTGDRWQHYSQWAQEKNRDLYQDLALRIVKHAERRITDQDTIERIAKREGFVESRRYFTQEQFDAFQVLTGALLKEDGSVASAGRNIVKTPLTAFIFGSALPKAVKGMERAFIQGIYDTIQAIYNGEPNKPTLQQLLTSMNVLLQRGGSKTGWDTSMSIEKAMSTPLSPEEVKALGYAFGSIMGSPTKEVMEGYFATLIHRRSEHANLTGAAFDLYQVAKEAARAAYIDELMKAGELKSRTYTQGKDKGQLQQLADLSAEQEAELDRRLANLRPIVHTDLSAREDDIDAGLFLAKTSTKASEDKPYQNKVFTGQPVATPDTQALRAQQQAADKTGQETEALSEVPTTDKPYLASSSQVRIESEPRAFGLVSQTHSADSAGMHKSTGDSPETQGLNVHDEVNTGVDHIDTAARAINAATVDTFLHYSPAAAVRDMLVRQMTALQRAVEAGELPATVPVVVAQLWADRLSTEEDPVAPAAAFSEVAKRAELLAYEADRMRLGAMASMEVMDQYTWEGGQFRITEDLRTQAEGMLAALDQTEPPFGALGTTLGGHAADAGAVEALSKKIEAVRKLYDGSREEKIDPIDKTPKVKSAARLGAPGVIGPAVVDALPGELPVELREDVQAGTPVIDALNKLPVKERVEATEAIATVAAELPRAQFSPFGEIGPAITESHPVLTEFLAKNGTVTVDQLAPVLDQVLKTELQTPFTQFNRVMLKQLARFAPKDLVIRYITPDTKAEDVLSEARANTSRGWFVVTNGGHKEIYILSPEFKYSGIQPELLLHEMLHGHLALAIENPHTEQAKKLVAELEVLRSGLAKLLERGRLSRTWAPAVANVHELVSWGMTNKAFQDELRGLNLTSLKLGERPAAAKKLDGRTVFGKFLKSVLEFLLPGKGADARYESALGLLLHNTASLFAEVAEASPSWRPITVQQNLSMAAANPVAKAWRYTTQELFEALGAVQGPRTISDAFTAHLGAVLDGIVTTLHGAGGYLQANRVGQAAMTPQDVWDKAQATGEAPFLSQVTPYLALNPQEAFVVEQVEATVREAISGPTTSTNVAYTELTALYREVRAKLKPSDFKTPGLYDMVFKVEAGVDKKSDFLARFAALGLANEEFHTALRMTTERNSASVIGLPLEQKLKLVFEKLMNWLSGLVTHNVEGEPANLRLQKLVRQLVDIEASKRMAVAVEGPLSKFQVESEEFVAEKFTQARELVSRAASSALVKNSRFGVVKLAGATVSLVAKDQVARVIEHGLTLRNIVLQDRQGFVAGIFNSIQGPTEKFRQLLRMAKKNEKVRKQMIEDTAKLVINGFQDGASMSTQAKAAVTQVFLRTGLHTLLASMTMAQIQAVVEDPAVREKAIADRVQDLAQFPARHYYVKQAKALGFFKARGQQRSPLGMLNGGNIARLYGTPVMGQVTDAQAKQAEEIIDQLAALYAVQYQQPESLALAQEVLRKEANRTDAGNGVEQALLLHKELDKQSRERLFAGSDALRMHGYTPEIYNPNTSLRTGRTLEERITLEEMGYTQVMAPGKDPNDPDQALTALYVLKDGGMLPYLTGAVSLKGQAAKGSSRYLEVTDGQATAQVLHQRRRAVTEMFAADPNWDPSKAEGAFMTPVLNEMGQVAKWRYLMSEANKDSLLERDSRVEYVLGTMAGSIFDKEVSKEQNLNAVQALHDLYMKDRGTRPASFVEVSPGSSNAEMRELYRMLPDTMQKQIKEVWGPRGMQVPYELLDTVFGYRKLSAARAFDKKAARRMAARLGEAPTAEMDLNAVEEAYVTGVELALYTWARGIKGMPEKDAVTWSRAAGVRVRRTERAWQEILQEVKDTIVVRGIKTMLGNFKSNISLLLIHGVNPVDILKHSRVAWKGAVDYKRDRAELSQLQLQLDSGYTLGNEQEIKARITMLEDAIARNPVLELIEAGLLPTIVEDVETDFDPYSYKTLLAKKADGLVSKINPGVRAAGRLLYMTHDTVAYRTLSQITQLSDFVSRYTLYQHLVSRKNKPMSKADAIEEASESFVNYDIPMHRGMQYLDDMGITMFTKYFLNIQRVLLKLGKDKPVQVLVAAALHQLFGRMDLVTESALPYRLGHSPFKNGPFEALGSLGELPAAQLMGGLLGGSSGGDWPQ